VGKWQGKFVIGLTGNIATGKSVVRKMLEHLGAYGIDADSLGHRAIARGAPGYQPIVDSFGRWILAPDGQIDRVKLGKIVFSDAHALDHLEKIVHPLVRQAIDLIIQRSSQTVVVIEAIKLLEAGIAIDCDSIWASYVPPEIQLHRLMQNRRMPESEARQRMNSQPPQEQKVAEADVVIKNGGSFEETWRQVVSAFQKVVPEVELIPARPATQPVRLPQGDVTVIRGKPRHSQEIANLLNRIRKDGRQIRREDVMAGFGEKAFLLLQVGPTLMGVVGWQVENLVSRTTDIVIDPLMPGLQALPPLITEMERASKDLQCEASLVFAPLELAKLDSLWRELGYEQRGLKNLGVQAWQEAAQESMPDGTALFFKQLRHDRILRPI
jgi:dephospho-CoA kinase